MDESGRGAGAGGALLERSAADSPVIRTFPCTGCGAKFSFAPGTRRLRCEFCGTENAIAEDDGRVEELDYATYLKALEGKQETVEEELVRCQKCGAEEKLGANLFAGTCAFCNSPVVSKSYANRRIKPKSIVPFQVDRARAQDAFRRWIRKQWLAPNDLKRYARSDAGLAGMYLPFWTYDCQTSSDYAGERGENYTVRQSDGKTRTEVRWRSVSGHVEKFHDDVLVNASRSLPPEILGATSRWDLKGLVPYQPEFVSGFHAEAYQVGLKEGFPAARAAIDEQVAAEVRRQIGGDHQRIHSVQTRYSGVRFKHVLLPCWISAYRYHDKAYRFLVNGQTGEVSGQSPLSWIKVTLLAIAILAGLFVVLVMGSR